MTRLIHFEILSDNPTRSVAFYKNALGWDIANWGNEEYYLASTGPADQPGINGAIMARHFPQAVINTVEVDDLAAATGRIEAAGGTRVDGPNEIPEIGAHSYFTDPDGTYFGVLQPVDDPENMG